MSADVQALPHPDWLFHHLTVTGPPAELLAFRQAAAGPGHIPWRDDLAELEEGWFHLLAAPPLPQARRLSLAGCRILARQLREAVEARRDRLAEQPDDRGCPFDLHRLIPVPAELLRLGPDHPAAQAWLWRHWGTTQALRHVTERPAGRREPAAGPGRWALAFWSADWTPWPALAALRARWPALRLDLRPRYDGP